MPAPAARQQLAGAAGTIEVATQFPDSPRAVRGDSASPSALRRDDGQQGGDDARSHVRGGGGRGVVGSISAAWVVRGARSTKGRGETDDMLQGSTTRAANGNRCRYGSRGFSFGGAVAARASSRAEFDQVILVARASDASPARALARRRIRTIPASGPSGGNTTTNTIVVHGDLDETVPLADSIAWAGARDVLVAVVPGGEHFFHRKLHILREIVTRWCALKLPAGRAGAGISSVRPSIDVGLSGPRCDNPMTDPRDQFASDSNRRSFSRNRRTAAMSRPAIESAR